MRKLFLAVLALAACFTTGAQTPPVVPVWALKHIVWEDNSNTRQGAEKLVQGYKDHDIPVSAIIIDSPWSTAYNNFEWDEEKYPGHDEMLRNFADANVKVILWLTGAVNTKSNDTREDKCAQYDYVVEKKYGINDSAPHDWWKGTGVHIDFTNPKAVKWWNTQLDKVFVDAVYGWKVDQGEFWFGNPVKTSIGTISNLAFRPYYYDSMYDYTVGKKPDGITIARPYSHQGGPAASVNKVSVGWCGDFSGDWEGLKQQIDNIYRSARIGYGAVACEVGGFYGAAASKEQLIRYAQFGCMTATMINGGENGAFTNHLPWYHGDDAADIYRECVNLHYSLIPYFFSTIVDCHLASGSLINHVSLEEESHMLGDFLFTKAITAEGGAVEFHLPTGGEWIDYWTGEWYKGGELVKKVYPLDKFPLLVKAGAVIPMEKDGQTTIVVYSNGRSFSRILHLPDGDGVDYHDVVVWVDGGEARVVDADGRTLQMPVAVVAAPEGAARLQYWGSADKYLDAQGQVLLENVDQAMDLYPPTTEFSFPRKQALLNFDAVVHNTFYDKTTHLKDFATNRAYKVLADLEKPMDKGVRFYKIYNDGFIIRTGKLTFAVDLNGRSQKILPNNVMLQLVSHCSGLFITHNHSDHYDMNVVNMFKAQGKPIYAIDEFCPDDTEIIHCYPPTPGKSKDMEINLGGTKMKVKIFPGHQETLQCNNYVFYLPGGYTVAHIGDQYNEGDLAWIDKFNKEVKLDVLIMECWINDEPRSIAGYNPKLIISGHENEIGHTIDHREAFWLSYYKMDEVYKIKTPHVVMGWGEWYTYQ